MTSDPRHVRPDGLGNVTGHPMGYKLAFIVGFILITQTLLYDPSAAFRDEIASQMGDGMPLLDYDFVANFPYSFGLGRSGEERKLAPSQESSNKTQHSWGLMPNLFSPTFWPYDYKDVPVNPADGNATAKVIPRYPGKETIVTDYTNDVVAPLRDFMLFDRKQVVIPSDGTKSTSDTYATCRFVDYQYSFHFSHFVQQLFRCWSFWRANQDKTPVFVTSQGYNWNLVMEKEFNRGIMNSIRHAGVQIVNTSSTVRLSGKQTSISAKTKGPILEQSGNHYQVTSMKDMRAFQETTLASLNLTTVIPKSSCGRTSKFPRIAVLNRRKSRRIRNAKDVASGIQEHFNLSHPIPVAYLENVPFRNQVAMMASVDILVTAHGAQETGIAFMPQCGGVLELIPHQYFFPRFYGTLAASAGINHAYIYLADNTSDHTMDILQRDIGFLAPSMRRIKEGVTILVNQWQNCCEMLHSSDDEDSSNA